MLKDNFNTALKLKYAYIDLYTLDLYQQALWHKKTDSKPSHIMQIPADSRGRTRSAGLFHCNGNSYLSL